MNIGDEILLERVEWKKKAYQDQFGVWHEAYIVTDMDIVTVYELFPSKETWAGDIHPTAGVRAKNASGGKYICNENGWNGASMTGIYNLWRNVDTNEVYVKVHPSSRGGVPTIIVYEDGTKDLAPSTPQEYREVWKKNERLAK